MRYDLIVIWETGEKDIYTYSTEEEAEQAGANMVKALGHQIAWYGVTIHREQ